MQDHLGSRSSEMFVFSKLLTTLKIRVYFKMITLRPVSILGQVGFQETLSSIKRNKLSKPENANTPSAVNTYERN